MELARVSFPYLPFLLYIRFPFSYNGAVSDHAEGFMETGKRSDDGRPRISLRFIGKEPDDLRWFIRAGGRHAGGITVHSAEGSAFSYGVAVSPALRGRGVASAAIPLFYRIMQERGFSLARVRIKKDNIASLRLHRSLGFLETDRAEDTVTLERALRPWTEETI